MKTSISLAITLGLFFSPAAIAQEPSKDAQIPVARAGAIAPDQ